MLRTVSGTRDRSCEKRFRERKKIRMTKSEGPSGGPGWIQKSREEDHPLGKEGSMNHQMVGLHSSLCSVGFLCQLGHIREKRLRLADEKTHGR